MGLSYLEFDRYLVTSLLNADCVLTLFVFSRVRVKTFQLTWSLFGAMRHSKMKLTTKSLNGGTIMVYDN